MKRTIKLLSFLIVTFCILAAAKPVHSKTPRSKFYDFSEQTIDGKINKPTTLFTNAKDKVKFDRLLMLKRDFMRELLNTAKERVFK